jgi:LysM repeat protein
MTPARLLAPAALVAAAVALFVVVSSGSGEAEKQPHQAATATPAAKRTRTPKPSQNKGGGTYTVKPGDTPSGIAAKLHVDVDDLLAANPDVDASALTVGAELKVP